MVNDALLKILRCPYCVSKPVHSDEIDPGQLHLINNAWLVCQEPECNRRYPIEDNIPLMLIEEGDKYRSTPLK